MPIDYIPSSYQTYCTQRIIDTPFVALHLEMGLGKSVITLTALKELKFNRWAVNRILVIAPKKVAEATWSGECAKWSHLSDLRVSTVLGTEKERLHAVDAAADLYVINRDNVVWLVKSFIDRKQPWPFDCVVLDESTSFKNYKAKRFRALKSVRPQIKRLIELTGTPAPNGLMDLWAQMYLLDGGARLGRTISVYRDIYFDPDKRNGMMIYSYRPKKGADRAIFDRIADICVSMRAEDYLDLPEMIFETIPVRLDRSARNAYDLLERDALLKVSEDEWVSAGTAGVLTGKLLQICNGAVYDEDGRAVHVHDCKLDAFMETVEQLNGEHALVFYQFQHDRDRLTEALRGTGLRVRVYTDAADADAWNAGEVDVLLAHPASCAYGLNLQQGGRHIIWFGLTWNLEEYQQANKRLHRRGQERPVIVHVLAVEGGVDEDVLRSLSGKRRMQDSLLDALKVRLTRAKCTQSCTIEPKCPAIEPECP